MGRTVPNFRMTLEAEIARWDRYRKSLRQDEREAFDRMMDACRLHASASGQAVRPEPIEAMLVSIMLEHQRRLESLEKLVKEGIKLR
jgi:hypothetical protein